MKYIMLTTIFAFLISCATTKSESQAYRDIKNLQKAHRYSLAAGDVFKFEAAYPESKHLCELWEMHIQYYSERNSNAGYVEKVRSKHDDRCK